MRLYFKKLIIENFLSFGHSELDLAQQGYVTVHGKNNNIDDFAQSNGSGKSSIFDALMWCLTGDTVRGNIKNICNILVNDGCYVKLILDVDEDKLHVKLSMKKANNILKKRNRRIFEKGSGFDLLKESLPMWVEAKISEIKKNENKQKKLDFFLTWL